MSKYWDNYYILDAFSKTTLEHQNSIKYNEEEQNESERVKNNKSDNNLKIDKQVNELKRVKKDRLSLVLQKLNLNFSYDESRRKIFIKNEMFSKVKQGKIYFISLFVSGRVK